MTDQALTTILWAAGLVTTIILALIAAIYSAERRRYDRLVQQLDEFSARIVRKMEEHITQDTVAHERTRANEIEISNLKAEIGSLRERWHDLNSDTTKALGQWYASIMEELTRRFEDIFRRLDELSRRIEDLTRRANPRS